MATFREAPRAALTDFDRSGFHVEPEVWTAEQCTALVGAAADLPAARAGAFAPVMAPHREHPAFLHALRNPRVVTVMEWLVGGLVSGLQSQLFYCLPGTPGFLAHQDNHYVDAKPGVFASAWTALEEVSPENGGLFVYPGSHQEPILAVEPVPNVTPHARQALNAIRQGTVVPPGYTQLALHVPRGAIVFLHSHLIHGSYDNRSSRSRTALLLTYIRQGERFRPGASAGRAEVAVY